MYATVTRLPVRQSPAAPSPVATAAWYLTEAGLLPVDAEEWGDPVLAAAMAGLSRVTAASVTAILEASGPS